MSESRSESVVDRCAASLAAVAVLSILFVPLLSQALVPQELNDQTISDAVETEIRNDFLVPVNKVVVVTSDGIVTLTGVVNSLVAKERAARIAESVKGVRSVVNRVSVRPNPVRTPSRIEAAVRSELVGNPATETYEVVVDARPDGTVVLTGGVESWAEKALAEKVAKSVSGVTGVVNQIRINYGGPRPDSEIKTDARERLRWNVLVDESLINTRVDDGTVYLSGTVGSAAEKRQALSTAWVTGVHRVDASRLEVDPWARDKMLRNPETADVGDEEIESAIRQAFRYDARVPGDKLTVQSLNGVVALRGTVGSLEAKRAAGRAARHTVGVSSVDNRIEVRLENPPSDRRIARNVRAALERNSATEDWQIDVTVDDGFVTLAGTVDDYYEKSVADNVASRVKGVKLVQNLLTVADATRPFPYDPYFDPWAPNTYEWYDYQPRYSLTPDTDIKESIEAQMWWSPFIDSDEVKVTVENGVATLTGTVDSHMERGAARENALEGGATWVENNLEVDPSGT